MKQRSFTKFAALPGSLHSSVKLNDKQLREARKALTKNWARVHKGQLLYIDKKLNRAQ